MIPVREFNVAFQFAVEFTVLLLRRPFPELAYRDTFRFHFYSEEMIWISQPEGSDHKCRKILAGQS
jgi:hypothetical protein